MENPIKMDDLGVPPFSETPIYEQVYGDSQNVGIPSPSTVNQPGGALHLIEPWRPAAVNIFFGR